MGKSHELAPGTKHAPGQKGKWKGKTCGWEDCDLPVKCRGYCSKHYLKVRWASGHRPPSVNPTDIRDRHLKHRYGISLKHYNELLAKQGGVCAICRQPPSASNTRSHWGNKLCVDHCHDSEKVRGLLCNDCNLAVGYGKTPEILIAAAEYLQSHT